MGTGNLLGRQGPEWSEAVVRQQRCTGQEYVKMEAQEVAAEVEEVRKRPQVARMELVG